MRSELAGWGRSLKCGAIGFLLAMTPCAIAAPPDADHATSSTMAAANCDPALLNETQRLWLEWTIRQFGADPEPSRFEGMSDAEKKQLEEKWLTLLEGPENAEIHGAMSGLSAMRSTRAVRPLLRIAMEEREKNNRGRWMAVRALGLIGDQTVVPRIAHLVYHGNQNTRLWAQITLVRLTGQNFGYEWEKWGEWWNARGGEPAYDPKKIEWIKKEDEKVYGTKEMQMTVDAEFVEKQKAKK